MKRPNITPGEWIVSRLASPDYAPQYGIYSSENVNDFAIIKGDEANARAIAALPDLLAALEQAYQLLKTARQYFPKRIRNSDTFQLELACAAIGSALTKAGYTF